MKKLLGVGMLGLFSFIAFLIGIYSILCLLRIFLTWVPMGENAFTAFLASVCDPFLNCFKFPFTRLGAVDISPMLALIFLYLVQSLFERLATMQSISAISVIFAVLVIALKLVNLVLLVLFLVLLVRFIFECIPSLRYNQFSVRLDTVLYGLYTAIQSLTGIVKRLPILAILTLVVLALRILLGAIIGLLQ